MLLHNTQAITQPPAVVLENRQDGQRVILADHIREVKQEDDSKIYQFNEVIFMMPEDRYETVETLTENFAAWWEYGQQEEDILPTIEQRVSDLEEALMELLEG